MSSSCPPPVPPPSTDLSAQDRAGAHVARAAPREDDIRAMGRRVFAAIGSERPSAFHKNYWSAKIMEWSMTKPEFKLNMFRLVDVLPTLRSSAAIASHVREYLAAPAQSLHRALGWGMNVPSHSIRAGIAAILVRKGVREMARQFIAGETAASSLPQIRRIRREGLAFTVDLLGEFSVSEREATAYLHRYQEALSVLGAEVPTWPEARPIVAGHAGERSPVCLSVKLSALYSQCNSLNFERSVEVLSERLTILASHAKTIGALLYVDAEDTANNPIIYESFKRAFGREEFRAFPYPGIVVQAYAKNSMEILQDLIAFAQARGAPIAVRLVKGAYLDHESVIAAQNHWESPLFEEKEDTDANYEECSRFLLDNIEHCLPAFGSHNVRSLAHACCYAASQGIGKDRFELQMLFGMAEPIARAFAREGYLVRLYVPLGEMIPGMGYLVRRLLENTSNESFLRHTFFEANDIERLLDEPIGRNFPAYDS